MKSWILCSGYHSHYSYYSHFDSGQRSVNFLAFRKSAEIVKKIRNDYDILKPTVDLTILTEDRMTIKWGVDRDDD